MGNYSNALARVFTQKTLSSLITCQSDNSIFYKTIRRYNIPDDGSLSNSEIISEIYSVIEKEYRYEYYYKNTLLNKLLINVHRVNTTTALTEIPIAKSKADFIMINGKAVVYEIKTDLDSLDRLDSQINDYYKAFDHVCIVTGEKKRDELYKKVSNTSVGLYILTSEGTIRKEKEPVSYRDSLSKDCMFKILRKAEYEDMLRTLSGMLPQTPPVQYYEKCKQLLCSYPIEQMYPLFLDELKKRNKIKIDYSFVPMPIRFLVYFSDYSKNELEQLDDFLNRKFEG